MELMEQFVDMVRGASEGALVQVNHDLKEALLDGDDDLIARLRSDRRRLRELPQKIVKGSRGDLIAQWPAEFGELPLWFSDPAEAARLDPPGEPCITLCPQPLSDDELRALAEAEAEQVLRDVVEAKAFLEQLEAEHQAELKKRAQERGEAMIEALELHDATQLDDDASARN